MTTDRADFIPLGWTTMLCTLSWDDGNWQSMTFTWGGIIILWPLSWGDTTDGSFFITKGCITMLRPLPWDDDIWRSMSHTLGMYKHVLSAVMRWWQLTAYDSYLRGYNHTLTVVMRRLQLREHVSYLSDIDPCSDRYHETKTTDGA